MGQTWCLSCEILSWFGMTCLVIERWTRKSRDLAAGPAGLLGSSAFRNKIQIFAPQRRSLGHSLVARLVPSFFTSEPWSVSTCICQRERFCFLFLLLAFPSGKEWMKSRDAWDLKGSLALWMLGGMAWRVLVLRLGWLIRSSKAFRSIWGSICRLIKVFEAWPSHFCRSDPLGIRLNKRYWFLMTKVPCRMESFRAGPSSVVGPGE